uniref:transposase n=1 Tax=unclassified Acinetobacter TaxID=196816 RepID=UPI00211F3E25
MKTSKFTDSQIMSILKQAESGTPVATLCREHGMSNAIAVPQFFTRGSSFELPLVLWVFYRVKIKLLKFFFQTNSLELF